MGQPGKTCLALFPKSKSGIKHEMCLNKDIFLSNKNRDYDMQVKLQIYEGGSELERDHTGNGYQPDKTENQGFD